jgi:hypothetical protein
MGEGMHGHEIRKESDVKLEVRVYSFPVISG